MHNDCQTIEKCQENRLKGAEFVRKGVHFFVAPCSTLLLKIIRVPADVNRVVHHENVQTKTQ